MKLKHLYLILAVVGLVVPYFFLIQFLIEYGADPKALARQLFGTPAAAFFVVDLLISSVVFIVYLKDEAARLAIRNWGVYLIPLFTVGLSFALPLFLFVRESRR
jgi:Protein of unknown function DUF2834